MLTWFGRKQADGTWFSAAAERNKEPLVGVLRNVLPRNGVVLEIASGTGQHIVHFASAFPELAWQPSDPHPDLRASIRRRTSESRLPNVKEPLDVDVGRTPWPLASADAIVCINMIHVAPWSATSALFEGAASIVARGGAIVLYGPYRRFGQPTSESNDRFDADLRAQDPAWGVRDMEAVGEVAEASGFALADIVGMPANNFSLVFRHAG